MSPRQPPSRSSRGQAAARPGLGVAPWAAWAAEICLLLMAVLLPLALSLDVADHFTLPKLVAFRTLLPAALVAWLTWRIAARALPSIALRPWALLSLVGLAIAWIVSAVLAEDRQVAIWGIYGRYLGLASLLGFLLVLVMAVDVFRRPGSLARLAWTSAGAGSVVGFYGFLQLLGLDPAHFVGTDLQGRAISTLGNPILTGAYLDLVIPLTIALVVVSRRLELRVLAGLAAVLQLLGLALTYGRGAWFGALVGGLVPLAAAVPRLGVRRLAPYLAAALGIFLVLGLGATAISTPGGRTPLQRVADTFSNHDPSRVARSDFTTAGLHMLRAHPLIGIGPDEVRNHYGVYRAREEGTLSPQVTTTKLHNDYLNLAVTSGLPALLAFLALLGIALWSGLSRLRVEPALGVALTAGVAAYAAQAYFSFQDLSSTPLYFLALGILLTLPLPALPQGRGGAGAGEASGAGIAMAWSPAALALVIGYVFSSQLSSANAAYYQAPGHGLDLYRQAVNLDPGQSAYRVALGQELLRQPNGSGVDEGLDQLREANQLVPRDSFTLAILAQAEALHAGTAHPDQSASALRHVQRALELDPLFPVVLTQAAEAYGRLGDHASQRRIAQRAVDIAPSFAGALAELGDAAAALGDDAGAVAAYRHLVEVRPDDASAHETLGILLARPDQADASLAELRRAVELVPDDPGFVRNLARALANRSPEEARNLLRRLLQSDPSDQQTQQLLKDLGG